MVKQADTAPRGVWLWPGLIVGLLLLEVVLCVVAVVLAVRAPGGQVVPDYYNRALQWDQRHEADQAVAAPASVPEADQP
ncbi:MAG TPA: FixH family protein [Phycisphaeraceae bacterium]